MDRIADTLGIENRREIMRVAEEGILALGEADYAHSLDQRANRMDVYGLVRWDRGWYVKLYVDEEVPGDEATVCSFHPPEFALRTCCRTIPAGGEVASGESDGDIGEKDEGNDA